MLVAGPVALLIFSKFGNPLIPAKNLSIQAGVFSFLDPSLASIMTGGRNGAFSQRIPRSVWKLLSGRPVSNRRALGARKQ